jgi:hypothetical protein
MPTPNLSLPFIAQGQAQKEVSHNDALNILDALVQISVKSRTQTAPPGSPAQGDRYIVPTGASGVWVGQTNKVAIYRDAAWVFFTPKTGWVAWIESEGLEAAFHLNAWQAYVAVSPNGAAAGIAISEEELTLTGASVNSSIVIPNRAICLAVSSRTTLAITGATSYSVGISGNTGKFGSSLGIALGSTNIGVIGPEAFYANTQLVVTAGGSNFTGGKVRLAIQFLSFAAPSQ